MLMSPRSTFQSCGTSSSWEARAPPPKPCHLRSLAPVELGTLVRPESGLGVGGERPELRHREHGPVAPDPRAAIEHQAARAKPDCEARSRSPPEGRGGRDPETRTSSARRAIDPAVASVLARKPERNAQQGSGAPPHRISSPGLRAISALRLSEAPPRPVTGAAWACRSALVAVSKKTARKARAASKTPPPVRGSSGASSRFWIYVGVAAVVVVAAVALIVTSVVGGDSNDSSPAGRRHRDRAALRRHPQEGMTLGDPEAAVTFVEFAVPSVRSTTSSIARSCRASSTPTCETGI